MSNKVPQEPKQENANTPPKKMTNAEIWLKMLEAQKTIEEARRNGMSYQEIREKYGFRFETV